MPWLPNKSNICKDLIKSKAAFEIYQRNRRNQNKLCAKTCLFTNTYFGPPVTGISDPVNRNYALGVFQFRRDIKTTKEYVLYTLLSLIADIGGFIGVLLGFSFLDIGGINNHLLEICFRNKKEDKKTKTAVKRINVKPTKN